MPEELKPIKETIKIIADKADTITTDVLIDKTYVETITEEKTVTYNDAEELMNHFEKENYITKTGRIKDTMKNALANGTLNLPEKFEAARQRFENIIVNAGSRIPIRDDSKEVNVRIKKQVMLSPEFQELWNKIKQKTTYRIQLDLEKFISKCVKDLKELLPMPKAKVVTEFADINIETSGVTHTQGYIKTSNLKTSYEKLPDILDIVCEECKILPSDVYSILTGSGREADYLANPQQFLEMFIEIVKTNLNMMLVDGIKYIKLDGKEYYVQEIFNMNELMANLDKDAVAVKNSVYDYVIYDSSTIERPFALALDNDPDVKLFFKLPPRFKINTPIGSYNPDWAVYMDKDGTEKMYFVLETKGNTNLMMLRPEEQAKIECGKKHFSALENDMEMCVVSDWSTFKGKGV